MEITVMGYPITVITITSKADEFAFLSRQAKSSYTHRHAANTRLAGLCSWSLRSGWERNLARNGAAKIHAVDRQNTRRTRSAGYARCRKILLKREAGIRVRGCSKSWRNQSQRFSAGRISLSESPNSKQRDSRRIPGRGDKTAVSRQLLHLSEAGAPTVERRACAHGPIGTDQPMVCNRKNRRHQALSGVPPAIRL